MRIELEISNVYSDLITDDVKHHLSSVCEIALQGIRREHVASRTVPASARIGSQPWQPKPNSGDESPGVVDVADQARFKRERDAKIS